MTLRAVPKRIGTCSYCGEVCRVTRDHVVPRKNGGHHTVPACEPCNGMKGDGTEQDFRSWLHTKDGKVWLQRRPPGPFRYYGARFKPQQQAPLGKDRSWWFGE